MIEHLQLSPEDIIKNEVIMREGNLALKHNYEQVKANVKAKSRYSRRAFRQELFAVIDNTRIVVRGIRIDLYSIQKIKAVKDIETEMIQTFSKLVHDRARYYGSRDHGTYLDRGDFLAYGFMGLLEAIYHYTQEVVTKAGKTKKVKFVTYAHWCISRHIRAAINRKKANYPWTVQMRKLYERYEKARRDFNGPTNFQEVVDFLGFTVEEQQMLHVAMTSMQSERGVVKPNNEDYWEDSKGFDYTCLAPQNTHFRKTEGMEVDEREFVTKFLSEFWVSYLEAETVYNYVAPHYGWKEELASKYGIKRQAIFECLRRLKQKLEARNITHKFVSAWASGKQPNVDVFVGPPPEGNKEKLALWQQLRNSLLNIQARMESESA